MRIYIAGRMTGIPEHNYPAFAHAAAAWRNAGWTVLNPAEHFGGDQSRSYYEYIEADIVDLKTCDAIAMLPGWDDEEARGSVWEQLIAKHILTIPIYDATQVVPLPTPPLMFAFGRGLFSADDIRSTEIGAPLVRRRPLVLESDDYEFLDG